jgi:hypothetical protein
VYSLELLNLIKIYTLFMFIWNFWVYTEQASLVDVLVYIFFYCCFYNCRSLVMYAYLWYLSVFPLFSFIYNFPSSSTSTSIINPIKKKIVEMKSKKDSACRKINVYAYGSFLWFIFYIHCIIVWWTTSIIIFEKNCNNKWKIFDKTKRYKDDYI